MKINATNLFNNGIQKFQQAGKKTKIKIGLGIAATALGIGTANYIAPVKNEGFNNRIEFYARTHDNISKRWVDIHTKPEYSGYYKTAKQQHYLDQVVFKDYLNDENEHYFSNGYGGKYIDDSAIPLDHRANNIFDPYIFRINNLNYCLGKYETELKSKLSYNDYKAYEEKMSKMSKPEKIALSQFKLDSVRVVKNILKEVKTTGKQWLLYQFDKACARVAPLPKDAKNLNDMAHTLGENELGNIEEYESEHNNGKDPYIYGIDHFDVEDIPKYDYDLSKYGMGILEPEA